MTIVELEQEVGISHGSIHAILSSVNAVNNHAHTHKQCYTTHFWRNSVPCVRTDEPFAQKAVCHFTALYCQIINDCILFLHSHFVLCTLSVLVGLFLSFFLASHTPTLQNFVPVHKLTAFNNIFLLWVAPAVLCSNLCCYILHWFSSDILLLQSVSAFFIMTRDSQKCILYKFVN